MLVHIDIYIEIQTHKPLRFFLHLYKVMMCAYVCACAGTQSKFVYMYLRAERVCQCAWVVLQLLVLLKSLRSLLSLQRLYEEICFFFLFFFSFLCFLWQEPQNAVYISRVQTYQKRVCGTYISNEMKSETTLYSFSQKSSDKKSECKLNLPRKASQTRTIVQFLSSWIKLTYTT